MNAIRLTDKKINLINGPDETLICGLASGADAGIGSTYNVMLPWFKELYENFCIGNVDAATEAQQKINRIIGILIRENVISAVKELVTRSGIDVGSATFPMKAYTKEESDKLLKECMDAGWTPLK
jgi:N-acetylneuraminate lyase